jgi:hypothetical protein
MIGDHSVCAASVRIVWIDRRFLMGDDFRIFAPVRQSSIIGILEDCELASAGLPNRYDIIAVRLVIGCEFTRLRASREFVPAQYGIDVALSGSFICKCQRRIVSGPH